MRRAPRCCVLLLALAGCADSTLTAKDGGAPQSAPDAGRRVNERYVTIGAGMFATREVNAGADGRPAYGPVMPLEGADVCIVQRRAAFASFEPFEPVEPPICAKSVGGEVTEISGTPSNADLLITVELAGFPPLVLTGRTANDDVAAPAGFNGTYSIVLTKEGAFDPWLEPEPEPRANHGRAFVGAALYADPRTTPARPGVFDVSEDVLWGSAVPGNLSSEEVSLSILPAGADEPFELQTQRGGSFMSLPPGTARFQYGTDNDHLLLSSVGGPRGNGPGLEIFGLPADTDVLELPVLAGHIHMVGIDAKCAPNEGDGELVDLATCAFAPGDSADADAGTP